RLGRRRLPLACLVLLLPIALPVLLPARTLGRAALDAWILHGAQRAGRLNPSQQRRLREDVGRYHDAVDALRERFRKRMRRLREQVDEKAPDAELRASLNVLLDLADQIAAQRRKLAQRTASYLTPTQRARIALDLAGRGLRRTP
ncbi:MAG: hypothetical protein KGK30_05360, partial [Elusimicrobia bacterium]|nr:hypothetical protein [Elusimicrobiota bacterium]